VTAVRDVAEGVRELTLSPPSEPLEWEPGQWISLHLPVGERPPLIRAYTLATPPRPSGELVLCLDRVDGGLGSEFLCGLEVGEEVVFAGPLGRFVLPQGSEPQLWLARYTGVVPFRAMLMALREGRRPPPTEIQMVYSARTPAHLAYADEFRSASREEPWFHLVEVVDEPSRNWPEGTGEVLNLAAELAGGRPEVVPMVCGTASFVRPLRECFHALGYDRRAVRWESYD
jgi:ferredoxin-NADP reductase